MTDEAFEKIVKYAATRAGDATPDRVRQQLRPMIQELLDEVASEIPKHWAPADVRSEGLAFALGYLHGRYRLPLEFVTDASPAMPVVPRSPCPFTHAHTRDWCGHEGCRES